MDTTIIHKPEERPFSSGPPRQTSREIVVRGIVEVTRNDRAEILDIRLRTPHAEEFGIVDDRMGCQMADGMEGASVEVTGLLIDAIQGRWLSVTSYHCDTSFPGSPNTPEQTPRAA